MSDFLKITSADNWFKQHPEKIAGVEYETTSFFFPIMVKGTKEDVLRVTGMDDKKQDNSKLPIELHRIIESGLQVAGVTRINFEDNFKTMIYGTKSSGTNISVKNLSQSDIEAEYKFEKRIYDKEKIRDFKTELIELKKMRFSSLELMNLIKMHNQDEKHLPVIEKIILPFFEYHLGTQNTDDKEKRLRLSKAKAKAIKLKLLLK